MDSIAIYVILIISILILYIAIKSKTLDCRPTSEKVEEDVPVVPIKVSDIFRQMFQDREPVPGRIIL
jgi:hypothetical protein